MERRAGRVIYTVLYDFYRGDTMVAGLLWGWSKIYPLRVHQTIFVAEDSPFVDTVPHLKNTPLLLRALSSPRRGL